VVWLLSAPRSNEATHEPAPVVPHPLLPHMLSKRVIRPHGVPMTACEICWNTAFQIAQMTGRHQAEVYRELITKTDPTDGTHTAAREALAHDGDA
jgi:hypothetical protein